MRSSQTFCWILVVFGTLGLTLGIAPAQGQSRTQAVVEGRITGPDGALLSYANVRIEGTTSGAATDSTGHFRFSTRRTGPQQLRVSMIGYASVTRNVDLSPGDTVFVRISLGTDRVALQEAVITGSAYTTGPQSQATLSPVEAVTTPGASGDLFRALQSFPGVASPGDGAGLFVRGGDVTETVTLLDQATVHHPYRYESPTGGTFGAIRPFLVKGTQFSTGGFSAKYGNALSGVLAMESQDRPTQAQQHVTLGLAGASLGLDQPLIEDKLGLRFSGNRSFTDLLFRVNGQRDDFETVPQGWDGNLSLTWDYGDTGQLKWFSFGRHNRIGVDTQDGAFAGLFRTETTNQLHNLQWTVQPGSWTVESSASWSQFATERTFGALDLQPTDAVGKLRVDAERSSSAWTLRTGAEVERRTYRFRGTVPTQPDAIAPSAPTRTFDETVTATRTGGYAELEASVFSPLTATVGVRTDHETAADETVVDPRASLGLRLSPYTTLRAAWGIYHQFPEPATVGEHTGANLLGAQRARHYVAGLRHERGPLLLRMEGYHKSYRNLVVRTGSSRFANAGTGHAQGVDLFAKYGAFLETPINGWISYSLLDSDRTQPRDRGDEVALDDGPAPFDLTHQFAVVGKTEVFPRVHLGASYRVTSGRPFTPVVDTEPASGGSVLPVDGPVGSRRMPTYQRLDLQLSYFWPFGSQQHAIIYAAVNNVLDRQNVVGVNYSPDYSKREFRTTDFRRSFYIGVTLQL